MSNGTSSTQQRKDAPRIAYTAVVTEQGSMLAIVQANLAGQTPVESYGVFVRHEEAVRMADYKNRQIGLSEREAFAIVASARSRS